MKYQVILTRPARKQLDDIPEPFRYRVLQRIDNLGKNPRPHDVRKIKGQDDHYRIRVGDYRIIYTILDRKLVVVVIRIGDRKEIYR